MVGSFLVSGSKLAKLGGLSWERKWSTRTRGKLSRSTWDERLDRRTGASQFQRNFQARHTASVERCLLELLVRPTATSGDDSMTRLPSLALWVAGLPSVLTQYEGPSPWPFSPCLSSVFVAVELLNDDDAGRGRRQSQGSRGGQARRDRVAVSGPVTASYPSPA